MPSISYSAIGATSVVPVGFSGAVTTYSIDLASSSASPLPTLGGRRSLIVYNNSAVAIYLGGSDVSAANGMPVAVGSAFSADFGSVDVFAIADSGSGNNIRVMEVS